MSYFPVHRSCSYRADLGRQLHLGLAMLQSLSYFLYVAFLTFFLTPQSFITYNLAIFFGHCIIINNHEFELNAMYEYDNYLIRMFHIITKIMIFLSRECRDSVC